MCMSREYIFLTLVILGPKSLGKTQDVYLQPLIYDLKMLWDEGVKAYDLEKKQNFNMRVTLVWTISIFLNYEMLFD